MLQWKDLREQKFKKYGGHMSYSIIIPVYNCHEYLKQCVESVLQAKDKVDLEVLLIDDGSSDGSETICDEYAEKFKEIIVRHINNSGPSVARNIGIDLATKDYIMFVDSDDFLSDNWIAEVDDILNKCNVDTLVSRMNLYNDNKKKFVDVTDLNLKENEINDNYQANVLKELERCRVSQSPCRYITKREIIIENSLKFKPGIQHEDALWTPMLLINCKSFYLVKKAFYNIRMREVSRGSLNGSDRRYSLLEICESMYKLSDDKSIPQKQYLYFNIYNLLVFLFRESNEFTNYERNFISEWFDNNEEIIKVVLIKHKIMLLIKALIGTYKAFYFNSFYTRFKVNIHYFLKVKFK